jgi:hypothetical protein
MVHEVARKPEGVPTLYACPLQKEVIYQPIKFSRLVVVNKVDQVGLPSNSCVVCSIAKCLTPDPCITCYWQVIGDGVNRDDQAVPMRLPCPYRLGGPFDGCSILDLKIKTNSTAQRVATRTLLVIQSL